MLSMKPQAPYAAKESPWVRVRTFSPASGGTERGLQAISRIPPSAGSVNFSRWGDLSFLNPLSGKQKTSNRNNENP